MDARWAMQLFEQGLLLALYRSAASIEETVRVGFEPERFGVRSGG